MDVGQSEIASGVPEGQPFVIDTQLMQDRCVKVMNFDRVLNGVLADFVGRPMDMATFETAACEPNAKAIAMVSASVLALPRGRSARIPLPTR